MSLTLLVIDSRAAWFEASVGGAAADGGSVADGASSPSSDRNGDAAAVGPTARSVLTLPMGTGTVLDRLADSLEGVADKEILVAPNFPITPAYRASLQDDGRRPVRVVDAASLDRRIQEFETSDHLLVVEARLWPVCGLDAATIQRCLRDYRGASYGVAVGADPEGTRELVECDEEGRVRRVQRFYNAVSWPEMGNTGIVFALLPARAMGGLRPVSLTRLRSAMSGRGVLSRDVPLRCDVLDLSDEGEFLAVQERVLAECLDCDTPAGYERRPDAVLIGSDCRIDPTARLVGPVVVQAGSRVDARATIVGPAVLGRGSRIGAESLIAQAVIAPGAETPAMAVIRQRVLAGGCSAQTMDADPQVQFSFSAARPLAARRYAGTVPQSAYRMQTGSRSHRVAKRVLDVTAASTALIVLSPLLLLMAILVWLDSGRPILFAHRRERKGGTEFPCLKFRTMVVDAHKRQRELYTNNEVDGPQFKMRDDPRVTRVGKWLRATNLDELPQLFNVLVGHMSLVGPRPSPFRENQICVPWRRARLSVRPGITGLWQICRDDDRARGDFHQWIYYDMTYVRNFSFWLDLKILVATVLTLGGRWSVPLSWIIPRDRRHLVPIEPHPAAA